MTKNEFQQMFEKNNWPADDETVGKFEKYLLLLTEWSQKMNLTAIKEPEEIRVKHFYDCLSLYEIAQKSEHLIDVGSGAGFPGLVLKIACPASKVTLVEPTGKRCTFLNAVIRELGLNNIEVFNLRAEDFAKKGIKADLVTARAVSNLPVLAELCIPLVKTGGTFAAMKGPGGDEEAKSAEHAVTLLGAELKEKQYYDLPGGDRRVNLIYKKVRATPKGYPRDYSQIKKKPL